MNRLIKSSGVGNNGFTLLEILVAMVILAVGVLGATAMQQASINSNILTRETDNCVNTAYDILDRIHADGTGSGSDYGSDFTLDMNAMGGDCPGDGSLRDGVCQSMNEMAFGNAILTVTYQSSIPIAGTDTVTASITWNHKGSTRKCEALDIVPTS